MRGSRSPQCRSMSSHGLKREGRSNTAPIAMTHEFRTTPRIRHMMIVMMGDRARTSSTSDVQAYHTPRPRHGNSPEPRRFAGDGASARPTRALRVRRCRCLPRCAQPEPTIAHAHGSPISPRTSAGHAGADRPSHVRTGAARPIGNTTTSAYDSCWCGVSTDCTRRAPRSGRISTETARNGARPSETVQFRTASQL
jgi:hypothetical protein